MRTLRMATSAQARADGIRKEDGPTAIRTYTPAVSAA